MPPWVLELRDVHRRAPSERLRLVLQFEPSKIGFLVATARAVYAIGPASEATPSEPKRVELALIATTVALGALDSCLREVYAIPWHPYVMGDAGVTMLARMVDSTLDDDDAFGALALSTMCGLIYRFEIAQKYRYAPGEAQTRLSSWGRQAYKEIADGDLTASSGAVRSLTAADAYGQILALLDDSGARSESWVAALHAANDQVPVGILK